MAKYKILRNEGVSTPVKVFEAENDADALTVFSKTKHGKPKEDCSVSLWKEIGRTELKGSHGPQH